PGLLRGLEARLLAPLGPASGFLPFGLELAPLGLDVPALFLRGAPQLALPRLQPLVDGVGKRLALGARQARQGVSELRGADRTPLAGKRGERHRARGPRLRLSGRALSMEQ